MHSGPLRHMTCVFRGVVSSMVGEALDIVVRLRHLNNGDERARAEKRGVSRIFASLCYNDRRPIFSHGRCGVRNVFKFQFKPYSLTLSIAPRVPYFFFFFSFTFNVFWDVDALAFFLKKKTFRKEKIGTVLKTRNPKVYVFSPKP